MGGACTDSIHTQIHLPGTLDQVQRVTLPVGDFSAGEQPGRTGNYLDF